MPSKRLFIFLEWHFSTKNSGVQSEKLNGIDNGFFTCKKVTKNGSPQISLIKGKRMGVYFAKANLNELAPMVQIATVGKFLIGAEVNKEILNRSLSRCLII